MQALGGVRHGEGGLESYAAAVKAGHLREMIN